MTNPLARLIDARVKELGVSERELARRAQERNEVLTNVTLNRLRKGETANATAKTIRGVAAALDLPLEDVAAAAAQASAPDRLQAALSAAATLPVPYQIRIVDFVDAMEREYQVEERERIKAMRPYLV